MALSLSESRSAFSAAFHVEDVVALSLEKSISAQILKETSSKQQMLDEQMRLVEKEKSEVKKLILDQERLIQKQLDAERQKLREEVKKEMRGNFDNYIKQLKEENGEKKLSYVSLANGS